MKPGVERAIVALALCLLMLLLGITFIAEPEGQRPPVAERPPFTPASARTQTPAPTARATRVLPSPTPSPQPIPVGGLPMGSLFFSAWYKQPGGGCGHIGIYQAHAQDRQAQFLASGCNLRVAPTADQIVYAQNNRTYHLNLVTKDAKILNTSGTNTWPFAWSPDAATLLLSGFRGGDVVRYEMPDGPIELLVDVPDAQDMSIASWAPTGTLIALKQWDNEQDTGQLILMDVADGTLRPIDQCASMGDWEPDGTRLACITEEMSIVVVGVASGERTMLSFGVRPLWSPDGTLIASLGLDQAAKNLYLSDLEAGTTRILTQAAGSISNIAWSPDSSHLALQVEAGTTPWPDSNEAVSVADIMLVDVRTGVVSTYATQVPMFRELIWAADPEAK